MSTSGPQRLYELLPLIHRALDEAQGGPLRVVLGVIGEEYDRLRADIGQLYDDWFIETCEEQLVPYIGELVGVPVEENTGAPAWLLRARVANALRHRRRKGLPSTLEQVIWETCGWNAVVLEAFQHLAATQHVEYVHLEHGRAVDVRRGAASLLAQGVPRTGHLADVRGGADTMGPRGLFNTFHVGLLLSRMQVYPVERSEPARVAEGHYTFHALGLDTRLFTQRRREEWPDLPPSQEMPLPLTPGRLEAELTLARERLTRPGDLTPAERLKPLAEPPFTVEWNDTPMPLADMESRGLEHWQRPGPSLVGLRSGRPRVEALAHHMKLEAWMGGEGPHLMHLRVHDTESLPALATALEEALRRASTQPAFAQARVLLWDEHLLVVPGVPLGGHHPVRFAPAPEDPESAHALGLTPEHARRIAMLLSHELPPATGESTQGRLRLRLGDGEPVTLAVPLEESPEEMARALRHQLKNHEGWHALAHEAVLLVLAEAPQASQYLRAEEDPEDPVTARRLGLSPRVAVDVRRGRLAFSLGEETEGRKLRVGWAFGRAEDLGAGPYLRETPDTEDSEDEDEPTWRAEVCADAPSAWVSEPGTTRFRDLAEALAAWERQDTSDTSTPGTGTRGHILLLDSSTYTPGADAASFQVRVEKGSHLRVEAADGELPTLDGALVAYGTGEEARLILDGLQLRGLEARGTLRLTVSHATVLGPLHAPRDTSGAYLQVELRGSLAGPVRLPADSTRLEVSDCILRGDEGHPAVAGEHAHAPGPATWMTRTTVLDTVNVESLPLAEDCLFARNVEVHHVQGSLLRTCALPWASRHLPRHRCLLFSAPLEAAEEAAIASGPEFVSRSPGEPGYARLADTSPRELRTGARDGGEFGVYQPLQEERRLAALRGVLEEYLPAGLSAGVFFID
ncbi:hypothetical protein [Vitiosangium sp. GDMCC 1.1324]|uniref:hypothetical protein n=1 Tax=Vitiosangium sp. (strain GDMCC 1.1324) TaxID=2138576 RepID=UPI000D39107A|nr:hypothetical protein [Vitiosangium sp. GDMCC 1.1324]PTL79527.1 hypothetical protein DAT35_32445 [Vitiosangium sp. GDMCC 1.1324]